MHCSRVDAFRHRADSIIAQDAAGGHVYRLLTLIQSMIRTRRAALAQSGYRFSLATNAERVCAEIMLKR